MFSWLARIVRSHILHRTVMHNVDGALSEATAFRTLPSTVWMVETFPSLRFESSQCFYRPLTAKLLSHCKVIAKVKSLEVACEQGLDPRTNLSGKDGVKTQLETEVDIFVKAKQDHKAEQTATAKNAADLKAELRGYELTYGCKVGPAASEEEDDDEIQEPGGEHEVVPLKRRARQAAAKLKRDKRLQSFEDTGMSEMSEMIKASASARAAATKAAEEKTSEVQSQILATLLVIAGKL